MGGRREAGSRKMHAFLNLTSNRTNIRKRNKLEVGQTRVKRGCRLRYRKGATGSTPMPMRINAARNGANYAIGKRHRLTCAPAVGAIGHCEIFPNSRNIIPGKQYSP